MFDTCELREAKVAECFNTLELRQAQADGCFTLWSFGKPKLTSVSFHALELREARAAEGFAR